MGVKTAIAWTEASWNPVRGCTKVNEDCERCYAMTVAYRFSGPGQPYDGLARLVGGKAQWTNKIALVEDHLYDPIRWQKPRRVFTNSMSDIFHKDVPDEYLDRIYAVMALAPRHTFQNLTKRPGRRREYLSAGEEVQARICAAALEIADALKIKFRGANWPLPNVWEGTSVGSNRHMDFVEELQRTPAAVRWVSYEPAIGPADFREALHLGRCKALAPFEPHERCGMPEGHEDVPHNHTLLIPSGSAWFGRAQLDWIVVGGESGNGARPFHLEWARRIVADCKFDPPTVNVPGFGWMRI